MTPFAVIEADPPWRFGDKLPGKARGAAKHYGTLTTSEIMRFPLPPIATHAVLFLWRVAAMQQQALDVMRAWDFRQVSEIVWDKVTTRGKPHFGMGRVVRMSHEVCLIGVRGCPKPLHHSQRSRFEAPVRRHSCKPDEFYSIVEGLYAGPRVRLFARDHREGWTSLGNELEAA